MRPLLRKPLIAACLTLTAPGLMAGKVTIQNNTDSTWRVTRDPEALFCFPIPAGAKGWDDQAIHPRSNLHLEVGERSLGNYILTGPGGAASKLRVTTFFGGDGPAEDRALITTVDVLEQRNIAPSARLGLTRVAPYTLVIDAVRAEPERPISVLVPHGGGAHPRREEEPVRESKEPRRTPVAPRPEAEPESFRLSIDTGCGGNRPRGQEAEDKAGPDPILVGRVVPALRAPEALPGRSMRVATLEEGVNRALRLLASRTAQLQESGVNYLEAMKKASVPDAAARHCKFTHLGNVQDVENHLIFCHAWIDDLQAACRELPRGLEKENLENKLLNFQRAWMEHQTTWTHTPLARR